jgi:hypothetical protein
MKLKLSMVRQKTLSIVRSVIGPVGLICLVIGAGSAVLWFMEHSNLGAICTIACGIGLATDVLNNVRPFKE